MKKKMKRMSDISEHVVPVKDEEVEDEIDVVHLKTRVSGCRR